MILSLHDLISLEPLRRLDRAIDHTYGGGEFEGMLVQPTCTGAWIKSPNVPPNDTVSSFRMWSVIIGNPGPGVMCEKPMRALGLRLALGQYARRSQVGVRSCSCRSVTVYCPTMT